MTRVRLRAVLVVLLLFGSQDKSLFPRHQSWLLPVLAGSPEGWEGQTANVSQIETGTRDGGDSFDFDGVGFETWGGEWGSEGEAEELNQEDLEAWGLGGAHEIFTAPENPNIYDRELSAEERELQAAAAAPAASPSGAPAGSASAPASAGAGVVSIVGQDDTALSAERVYPLCGKEYVAMYFNPDYQEMNRTVMKNCRVRVENKLQGCCDTVRFKEWGENPLAKKEDIVEGCSKCSVDCTHFYFAEFCNDFFGKACKVKRRPLSNLDFEIIETFCIPNACNNDHDIRGVLDFFNIRYRRVRAGWRYNYRDAELECDDGMTGKILIAATCVVGFGLGVWLCIFLLKPPPESKKPQRGRGKGTS